VCARVRVCVYVREREKEKKDRENLYVYMFMSVRVSQTDSEDQFLRKRVSSLWVVAQYAPDLGYDDDIWGGD